MRYPVASRPMQVVLILVFLAGAGRAQAPKFPQPILITSAGQSAEIVIVNTLFKKAELAPKVLPQAKVADLAGFKTLVLVPGFSLKGLGSAGINKDEEAERVKAVTAAARQAGMKVLVLHIGGKARRGGQPDEFSRMAVAAADARVVVKTGDEDQFFSKLAAERQIPIVLVDRMADLTEPLGRLFK